jgi:NitT/TauT family transport system substrate-binding protein
MNRFKKKASPRTHPWRWSTFALVLVISLVAMACGNGDDPVDEGAAADGDTADEDTADEDTADDGGAEEQEVSGEDLTGELSIAYQPGIGYASLIVMKQQGTLEEALPNMDVSWTELASGAAIRDAILAGDVQIGSGGVGPFYVGWDAGVGYRILSSMNNMDLWLMTMDDSIESFADLDSDSRIAMPAPDSIQSVHLRRAAQDEFGDPMALDSSIVAMPHPDGVASVLSGQISGHLTSPPFQFQLRDEGARQILSSYDLWGESTFNTLYVTEDYYADNREVMDIFYDLHAAAIDEINADPEAAGEMLSAEQGGEPSAEQFTEWITEDGIEYTVVPQGVLETGQFMAEIDMIGQAPASIEEILLDRALEAGGS